jgi:D-isomer specific 2-hydroxyacid dehydrogenase-like protein
VIGSLAVADPSVLVTWPDFDRNGSSDRLRAAGCDLRLAPKVAHRTPADMIALLDGVAAAIVSTDPFDADVLASAGALRVISRIGVGTDSIDVDVATRRGVAVCTTPGANASSTADHAVALMLAALYAQPDGIAPATRRRGSSTVPRSASSASERSGGWSAGDSVGSARMCSCAIRRLRRSRARRSSSSTSCCGAVTSCRSTCRSQVPPGT